MLIPKPYISGFGSSYYGSVDAGSDDEVDIDEGKNVDMHMYGDMRER